MAKTITLKLSPQIIADFQTCFENPQEERKHLYHNSSQRINQETAEVFLKRTLNVKTIENGKEKITESTLDEIDFEKTEMPSNVQWAPKDIAGKLESYEYLVGDSFWIKITNWAKLNNILNKKYNYSMVKDAQKKIGVMKSNGKIPDSQIKLQEEQIETFHKAMEKRTNTECIEAYTHSLFSGIILEKIKASAQQLQDKEFAELNKPEEKPKEPNKK